MDDKIEYPSEDPVGKYNGNEMLYVSQVLDSENKDIKKHTFVSRLEDQFSKRFGMSYGVAHNSGTATLHSSLAALGVGAGDEVISPAQTVIMCSFATMHHNAVPVYADVEPDTFNIDPEDIERKITSKTKAIIAVHMHGLPADMPAIMKIAKRHNIGVIEDSAQCVLGSIDGQLAGTFADAASFSFETKKHLSAGEGGMLIGNNKELFTRIRKTSGLGYKTLEAGQSLRAILPEQFQSPEYKRHDTLGWNYRMNELTAAVALAQVERIDFLVNRRIQVASYFLKALKGCDWILPQKTPKGYVNSWWTFACRFKGMEKLDVSWRDFWERYKANGGDGFYGGLSLAYHEPVMVNKPFFEHYLPKSYMTNYPERFKFSDGLCPVAEKLQPEMMQFKTNYRNLKIAKEKALVLEKTWKEFEGSK